MRFKAFLQGTNNSGVSEAVFSENNLKNILNNFDSLLGNQFGAKFYSLGEEKYVKKGSTGFGVRLINENGHQLRFNWDSKSITGLKRLTKSSNDNQLYLSSIDYWDSTNINFSKPTSTVVFLENLNVIQIWDKISKLIKRNVKGSFKLSDLTDISDASVSDISRDDKTKFLKKVGFSPTKAIKSSKKELQDMLSKESKMQVEFDKFVAEIKSGVSEQNSFNDKIINAEKKFDNQVYCDPDLVFNDIENMAEFITKSKSSKSLIICGMAGLSKTFHVNQTLKRTFGAEGKGWTYHSGMKTAPFSLYRTIFLERKKVIVFDEADDILKNSDIVVQLKPLIDTSGDNTMEYSSNTKSVKGMARDEIEKYSDEVDNKIENEDYELGLTNKGKTIQAPSKFYFKGKLIFISNMPAQKIDKAIMSRSLFIDVKLCASDVNKRIHTIVRASRPDLSDEKIEKVMSALGQTLSSVRSGNEVQYMTPELARKTKEVTVRSMVIAMDMMDAGIPNCERLAALYA